MANTDAGLTFVGTGLQSLSPSEEIVRKLPNPIYRPATKERLLTRLHSVVEGLEQDHSPGSPLPEVGYYRLFDALQDAEVFLAIRNETRRQKREYIIRQKSEVR